MVLYKITNLINGKMYFGITTNTLSGRWSQHKCNIKRFDYPLYKAMNKHGIENFKIEPVEYCNSLEELKQKEIEYINYNNTCVFFENSNGYNTTKGGDFNSDGLNTPVNKFDLNGNFIYSYNSIKEASEINNIGKKSIRNVCDLKQKLKSAGGYIWTYKYHTPSPYQNEQYVPVDQYDLNGNLICSYDSIVKASKFSGVNYLNLKTACNPNKISKTAGGFIWVKKGTTPEEYIRKDLVPIDKYDLNLNFICSYSSIKEASNYNNVKIATISACVNDRISRVKKFVFVKKDETPSKPKISQKKKILQYDLEGNFLNSFNSLLDIRNKLKYKNIGKISDCCKGKIDKAYGYKWEFK